MWLESEAEACHYNEVLQPSADRGALRRCNDVLGEGTKEVVSLKPQLHGGAQGHLYPTPHGDERFELSGFREQGNIGERLEFLLLAGSRKELYASSGRDERPDTRL